MALSNQLPPGHERLGPDDIRRFSICKGALYWDGKKIKAEVASGTLWAMIVGAALIAGLFSDVVATFSGLRGLISSPPATQPADSKLPHQETTKPDPIPMPAK